VRSIAALKVSMLDLEDPGLFENNEDLPQLVLSIWLSEPTYFISVSIIMYGKLRILTNPLASSHFYVDYF
jgi:hypothetical protein